MNKYSWIHQSRQISETLGEFQPLWPLYYRITHHSCISSLFLPTHLPCCEISCFSARSDSSKTLSLSLPASQTSNLEPRRGRTSCLMRYKYLNRQECGAQKRLLRQVDDAILAPSNAMISAIVSFFLQCAVERLNARIQANRYNDDDEVALISPRGTSSRHESNHRCRSCPS